MKKQTDWGRKETIVWPPHLPIYSLGSIAIALLVTVCFLAQTFRFSQTPLQRAYTFLYVRTIAEGLVKQRSSYQLIYVYGTGKSPRPAVPADLVEGETIRSNGQRSSAALSAAAREQGYNRFVTAAPRPYQNDPLAGWLRANVFDGEGLTQRYAPSLAEGAAFLALLFCLAMPADVRRFKQLKYGRAVTRVRARVHR